MTIPENPPYDPILLTLVGAAVTWWGNIEGILVRDLRALQEHPEVKSSKACKPMPIATSRLISSWIKVANIVNHEEVWVRQSNRFATELRQCAQLRHEIVHGFWGVPNPDNMHETWISIQKVGTDGKHIDKQIHVTPQSLFDIQKRFRHLYHGVVFALINSIHQFENERPKGISAS
jgi:hypothetical protein